jgi:hypothetical protein
LGVVVIRAIVGLSFIRGAIVYAAPKPTGVAGALV